MNQSTSNYNDWLNDFAKRRIFIISYEDIATILAGNGYILDKKALAEFTKNYAIPAIKRLTGRDITLNAANPGFSFSDRNLIATAIVLCAAEHDLPRTCKPAKPEVAIATELTDEDRSDNSIKICEKLIECGAIIAVDGVYIVLFTNEVHSAMRAVHTVEHNGDVIQRFERWLSFNSIGRDRKPENATIVYRKLILDTIKFAGYPVDRKSDSYIFCDYADLLNVFIKAADTFN